MPEAPSLSRSLRAGTRALEGLAGCEAAQAPEWRSDQGRWALPVTIAIDEEHPLIPEITQWWIVLDRRYPAGQIDFFPSKVGGIEATFHHQLFNDEGPPDIPWRSGKLCLETDVSPLKLAGFLVEPKDAETRLLWNVRRAHYWLEAAARGELMSTGDRFELPDFPVRGKGRLILTEAATSLDCWSRADARAGFVGLLQLPVGDNWRMAVEFMDEGGTTVAGPAQLGSYLQDVSGEAAEGIWIRLDEIPVLAPWQAPTTWSELVSLLSKQGIDLPETLGRLSELRWRNPGKRRGPRPRHPLLLGFPISSVVGEPPVRVHWIGFDLPPLSEGSETAPGFRTNARGRLVRDERRLRSLHSLPWLASENWSDSDLTARGQLVVDTQPLAILGCGALGSVVAELLVRSGQRRAVLVDGDTLEAGNLVRHTLDLGYLGENKATALARRLNLLSPHSRVEAIPHAFSNAPPEALSAIDGAGWIIDCTGDDGALLDLEAFEWRGARAFASLSLGPNARRLYLFVGHATAFPREAYVQAITPWLEEDWEAVDVSAFPREGVGCWHPLVPATYADICLLTSAAVKRLVSFISSAPAGPFRLLVLERASSSTEPPIRTIADLELS